ncbi:unnamed protein product [Trichogramma brassicae]|uniref:Uncharacterized protein n=1 Tax=Trichogramma brassicae TaxID=86971 RepID=A0A6H5I8X1_9HYME|nr:unnamed protein product [Trichogramma brassicae]
MLSLVVDDIGESSRRGAAAARAKRHRRRVASSLHGIHQHCASRYYYIHEAVETRAHNFVMLKYLKARTLRVA